jgi:hypothetical protein
LVVDSSHISRNFSGAKIERKNMHTRIPNIQSIPNFTLTLYCNIQTPSSDISLPPSLHLSLASIDPSILRSLPPRIPPIPRGSIRRDSKLNRKSSHLLLRNSNTVETLINSLKSLNSIPHLIILSLQLLLPCLTLLLTEKLPGAVDGPVTEGAEGSEFQGARSVLRGVVEEVPDHTCGGLATVYQVCEHSGEGEARSARRGCWGPVSLVPPVLPVFRRPPGDSE